MVRSLLRTLCTAALALGLTGSAALGSPPRLHTGPTRYVRLVHLRSGELSITLTAQGRKALRGRLAGNVLDASCTTLGKSAQGLTDSTGSSGSTSGSGPAGRFTYHALLDRHADFCDVGLAHRTIIRGGESISSLPGPPFDSIALTQKGAAYLDEDRVSAELFSVLETAQVLAVRDAAGHFPRAAKLVSIAHRTVIALASPDASPPRGVTGFFSDAANHAEAVGLSALGRRLFIDSNGGVLSTNAAEHLFRVMSGQVAMRP